jgi:hypothetical protein
VLQPQLYDIVCLEIVWYRSYCGLFSSIRRRGDSPVISGEGREGTFHIMSDYGGVPPGFEVTTVIGYLSFQHPDWAFTALPCFTRMKGRPGVWRYPSMRYETWKWRCTRLAQICLYRSSPYPIQLQIPAAVLNKSGSSSILGILAARWGSLNSQHRVRGPEEESTEIMSCNRFFCVSMLHAISFRLYLDRHQRYKIHWPIFM